MRVMMALSLTAALSWAAPVQADSKPKPFPEFKAKRVKAPKKGSKPKITIQIAPAALPAVRPAPETATAATPKRKANTGSYTWFWNKISPDADKASPSRLFTAMTAIAAQGSNVPAPRLQQMQGIADQNGAHILRSTIGTRVSPALVLAVITVESSGNATAVSSAGAQGLMQLMPATAERFGVTDSLAPSQNIAGGVKYLDWLMGEFDRDPILVLAGYNAGEGNVRKHAGVPPFAETRDYVPKVLAAFQVAKGLCKTPPELISDGCVFHSMK